MIVTGWSLAWIFTFVGIIGRSAQSVQGISMMIMFPLTFLSNAFVPEDTLPSWLQKFVQINPVSHVVTAVRDLANTGTGHGPGRLGPGRLCRRGRGLRAALGAGLPQGPLNHGRGLLQQVGRPAPGVLVLHSGEDAGRDAFGQGRRPVP